MAEPRNELVICPECGMQGEVRERSSGSFEEVVTDILPKCSACRNRNRPFSGAGA